ncbi:hypothetical protein ACQCSX_17975 [Pseudarthrobacter sp. P1]|uniref:hypothetical protein n=1 Tax=Pseudarthrobacter sp. P1 TaxID=3418418 RepID=UPI003CF82E06
MAMTQKASIPRRVVSDVKTRMRRLRPDMIPRRHLAFVLGCWAATVVLVAIVVFGDPSSILRPQQTADGDPVAGFEAPLWFRLALSAVVGVLAVTGVVVMTMARTARIPRARRSRVLPEAVLAIVAGFPALAMAADRATVFAIGATALFVFVEVLVHLMWEGKGAAAAPPVGVVVALPWLLMFAYQFTPLPGTSSWSWLAIFWFAATFAAFGTYYGIVKASESRVRLVRQRQRRRLPPGVVLAVVLAAAAVLALRFTVARGIFSEYDGRIWDPWHKLPMSWIHAAAVASLLAFIAVRSARRPLIRRGVRRVSSAISVAGILQLALSWIAVVVGMAVTAVSGASYLPDGWVDWYPLIQLAILVSLGIVVLWPRFHGTAGQWIALSTVLYLVPVLVLVVFDSALPPWYSIATAVQITLLLTVIATVLALGACVYPRWRIDSNVVLGLAVVPLVVIHAGMLLPAAWSGAARFLMVALALASLLLFMPPVAADPHRRSLDLLKASGALLLGLTVYVLALSWFQFTDESFTTLGTLWLSVTVIAALTFRSVPVEQPWAPAIENTSLFDGE